MTNTRGSYGRIPPARGWYDHHDVAWGDNRYGLLLIARGFVYIRPETIPGILLATSVSAVVTGCISALPQSGILQDGIESLFTSTAIGALTVVSAMWPSVQDMCMKTKGKFTELGRAMIAANMPQNVALELKSQIMTESLIDANQIKVAIAARRAEDAVAKLERSNPAYKPVYDMAREIIDLRCISHQLYANPVVTMIILLQCSLITPLAYWASMGWWTIMLSFCFSTIYLSLYDSISTGQMVVVGTSSAVEYLELCIERLAS